MRVVLLLAVSLFLIAPLAGCLGDGPDIETDATLDGVPDLSYVVPDPDLDMVLEEFDQFLPGEGVEIHIRVVKPVGDGPFPVIAQFTPYTAPGTNTVLNGLAEPACPTLDEAAMPIGVPGVATVNPGATAAGTAGCYDGRFDYEFVRRGYAFAYGDVRGTGDSTGCLDLRGSKDIADLFHLTEWLGTQEWSNGNVGFIGASYPGSEAHMAALAGNPHLKAVIPIVASTSFYHYHHNGGVPYSGQHNIGGTNTGYTQNAVMPTVNPQATNFGPRYAEEATCNYHENALMHGGLDQTGAYYDWWQERNLRDRANTVNVPVLMGQGLADWNVKPDHIKTWFNDVTAQKTLIAGQWPHAYPYGTCAEGQEPPRCDPNVPYGDWWAYATAFFDTYLKEIDTGMFDEDVAWVQDSTGNWHRSSTWPIVDAPMQILNLQADGTLSDSAAAEDAELAWYGCPDEPETYDWTIAGPVSEPCDAGGRNEAVVFESEPFAADTIVSGVPYVDLELKSEASFVHLTVLMEVMDGTTVVERTVRETYELGDRENYGYLNPTYRNGIDNPEDITPGEAYTVRIDLFPQEDVIKAGEHIRVTIASDDEGRSIEAYDAGTNTILLGPDRHNALHLPLRPADLTGTRLDA